MTLFKSGQYVVFSSAILFRAVSIGTGYGLSVMYAEIVRVLSVSRVEASLIQGIYIGLTAGGGFMWCGIIQKFGTGITSLVGCAVAATCFFSCAYIRHIEIIILLAGVISGLSMSISYLSSFISVSIAFKEDPRVPLTFVSTGSCLGMFLVPLLHELFIASYFWSGAFMLISGLILQCIPSGIWIHFVFKNEENRHLKESSTRQNICDKQLLQDCILWIILISCFVIILTGNIEAWFLVDQLEDKGFPRERGSILVSIVGLGNLCGRVAGSVIKYKWTSTPTIYHWLYLCPMVAVGHGLVLCLQYYYPFLVVVCLLHGIAFGIITSYMATIVYEITGSEKYPAAVALLNLSVGIGDVIGVMFGGIVRDALGSYDGIYYAAIGGSFFVTAGTAYVSWHVRRKCEQLTIFGTKTLSSKNYRTLIE